MKKAIFKGFAVAALALAVLFTGCKNETSNIETVRSDAVEITVKAFPGYNYVTWTKPEGIGGTITVLRDDGTTCAANVGSNTYIDTNVSDGCTYKYTAYVAAPTASLKFQYNVEDGGSKTVNTVGDLDETTAYLFLGNSSSASVKAINPICIKDGKLMTALDLCEFEDGGDEDFVINEDNIIFEKQANGTSYYVAFPTKAYLTYKVKTYRGNEIDVFGLKAGDFTNISASASAAATAGTDTFAFYTNDGAARWDSATLSAGEYTTVVEVAAVNSNYQKSYITAKNKFTVEALDVAANTVIKDAGYIDEGKTVRLIWTPATKTSDAKNWEAAKYTVYVQNKLTGVWTAIAGTVKETTEEAAEAKAAEDATATTPALAAAKEDKQVGKVVYYVDYTVPSNEVSYDFAVVLADNGKIEADINPNDNVTFSNNVQAAAYAKLGNVSLPTGATVTAAFDELDNDGKSNDAVLTLSLPGVNKDLKIKSAYYKKIGKKDNATYTASSLLLDSEITEAAIKATDNLADYTKYEVYAKNIELDSKVVFLYVLSDKDKADTPFVVTTTGVSGYSTPSISVSYPAASTVSAGAITATLKETAADGVQTWTFTYNNTDEDDYKKYDYAVFYGKLSGNDASEISVTSWTAVPLTPVKNAAKTAYEATKDVELKSATGLYGKTTNIADGKVTYTDKYVLKFVKSLKSVTETAGIAVAYSTAVQVQITK